MNAFDVALTSHSAKLMMPRTKEIPSDWDDSFLAFVRYKVSGVDTFDCGMYDSIDSLLLELLRLMTDISGL